MLGRRKKYRYYFAEPAKGTISIHRIKNQVISTKSAKVTIHDISGEGVRFSSHLKLPVSPLIIYEFTVPLNGHEVSAYGRIVRSRLLEGLTEYGVQFTEEHKYLSYLVKKLSEKILSRSRVI